MGNTIDYTLNEPITDKTTDVGSIVESIVADDKYSDLNTQQNGKIQYAVSCMQGWRGTMEDAHLLAPSLTISLKQKNRAHKKVQLKNFSLFGVFDGHGGDFSAIHAGENMTRILTYQDEWAKYFALNENLRSEAPGVEILKRILTSTFLDLDQELCDIHNKHLEERRQQERRKIKQLQKNYSSRSDEDCTTAGTQCVAIGAMEGGDTNVPAKLDRSGCTAVAVLLTPTHIICANSGDSRAILCKDNKAYPLSFDHKPANFVEYLRIQKAGGEVKMKRVDGDLAVSRGLGDFRYKRNVDMASDEQKVSSSPEFIVTPRDVQKDEFILIGCDGIWDVITNEESAQLVQTILDEGETQVGLVCEEMLDLCFERKSKDNMTICMVVFPACKMNRVDKAKNKNGEGAVLARRAKRESDGTSPANLVSSSPEKRPSTKTKKKKLKRDFINTSEGILQTVE